MIQLLIQLLVTWTFAANSTHLAARPLIKSAPYINGLSNARYLGLESMQSKKLSAWDDESPEVRERYLGQAREYIQYRRMGRAGAKSAFAQACLKEASRHVFCSIEATRIGLRLANQDARISNQNSRLSKSAVIEMIRKGNLSRLGELDRSVLIRAMNHFDDFTPLQSLADKVISESQCQSPQLALALGTKAEESFPEPKYIQLARQLYTKAATCGPTDVSQVNARFRAALLSIWKHECDGVEELLAPILKMPDADGFYARARYWRHYCATQLKNLPLAKQQEEELIKFHPMSFQNLMVNGDDTRITTLLQEKDQPRVLFRSILNPDLNKYALAIEALMELKSEELVSDVVDTLSPQLANGESGFRLYLAALTARIESALPRFKVLALLFRDQPDMLMGHTLRLYFPLSHYQVVDSPQNPVDPLLVLSLIRQESAFNSRAMSSAGARGLMQMMPATARQLGARSKQSLFDPKTNVRIGTKYLARQLRNYEGDVELTLAAYNAGFSRVDSWVKRYPVENRMLFLDLIPFKETRDYVTSIVRNYYWYVQLYSKESLKSRLAKNAKGPGLPIKMVSLEDTNTTAVQAR